MSQKILFYEDYNDEGQLIKRIEIVDTKDVIINNNKITIKKSYRY